jgi:hypothetical protein
MKHMAGRKRHSAEDIVRKLRRADELAAEGKTGEEIAAELEVSSATLYNWRRGGGPYAVWNLSRKASIGQTGVPASGRSPSCQHQSAARSMTAGSAAMMLTGTSWLTASPRTMLAG